MVDAKLDAKDKPKTVVIIDTNFLLIPAQFKVDIFEELRLAMPGNYEIRIFDRTLDELDSIITRQKGADKAAALMAKQIVVKFDLKIINSLKTEKHLNVDKLILNLVKAPKGLRLVVATQDKALKDELKKNKVPLVVLRQKNRLELIRG